MYRHGGAQLNHLMYVSSVGKRVGNSVEPRVPNNFGGSRQHGVQDSVENRLTRQMRFYLQKEVAGNSDPPINRTRYESGYFRASVPRSVPRITEYHTATLKEAVRLCRVVYPSPVPG